MKQPSAKRSCLNSLFGSIARQFNLTPKELASAEKCSDSELKRKIVSCFEQMDAADVQSFTASELALMRELGYLTDDERAERELSDVSIDVCCVFSILLCDSVLNLSIDSARERTKQECIKYNIEPSAVDETFNYILALFDKADFITLLPDGTYNINLEATLNA